MFKYDLQCSQMLFGEFGRTCEIIVFYLLIRIVFDLFCINLTTAQLLQQRVYLAL